MREESARHGVGLIIASEISDYRSWGFRLGPVPKLPDVSKLDDFIERQISEEIKRNFVSG